MTAPGIVLGPTETEIVRYVSSNPGRSGRQIAEALAADRGVARTTVLTVLERLRKKNLLSRRKRAGVYCYQAEMPASVALQGSVKRFVDHILGGSITPVLAFLADTNELTEEDFNDLERLIKVQRERMGK